MRRVLTERMSFRDLLRKSDPARVDRSRDVHAKSLKVTTMNEEEAWTFSYKSNPSTTRNRWHGYVRFFKEDAKRKDSADRLDCMVDCDCPDYRYRFAYNNARADAGALGADAWNDNNGQPPRPRSQGGVGDLGEGMCKHLISLGKFLKTKIEPDAPEPREPEEQEPTPEPEPVEPKKPISTTQQTTDAPEPDDSYSDTRSGDLQEVKGNIFEQLDRFAKSNPLFDVPYE